MRSLLSIAVILAAFFTHNVYAGYSYYNHDQPAALNGCQSEHSTKQATGLYTFGEACGGTTMPNGYFYNLTFIPISGGTWDFSAHAYCYSGYEFTGSATTGCDVIPVVCTAGEIKKLTTTSTTGTPNQFVNREGCQYKHTGGTVCAATGASPNEWACVGEYTATGETDTSTNFGTDAPDDGCITNSEGKQLCATNKTNCGTVNGVETCVDHIPPTGQCTFIPGGSFICEGTTTPSTTLPDGTPIPDQGTITGYDETGNPETGTIYGTQTGSDAISLPSEITGDITATVDETGTPDSGTFTGPDTSTLDTFITDIGVTQTVPQDVDGSSFGLGTQSATCNPNQFDFSFRTIGLNIDLCQAIEMVRGALWYLFAGLTFIYLMGLWDVTVRSTK